MVEKILSSATPSLGRRLMSMVYDLLLLGAVVFFAGFLFSALLRYTGNSTLMPVFRGYLVLVMAVYYLWFWLHGGQTLPMKTWHIQLVTADGSRLTTSRALLRFVLAWSCLIGVGILWGFFDRDRQFLHDRLAGTRLVTKL